MDSYTKNMLNTWVVTERYRKEKLSCLETSWKGSQWNRPCSPNKSLTTLFEFRALSAIALWRAFLQRGQSGEEGREQGWGDFQNEGDVSWPLKNRVSRSYSDEWVTGVNVHGVWTCVRAEETEAGRENLSQWATYCALSVMAANRPTGTCKMLRNTLVWTSEMQGLEFRTC